MARKKSFTRKLILATILGLSLFGAYTLYNDNKESVAETKKTYNAAEDRIAKVLEALKE